MTFNKTYIVIGAMLISVLSLSLFNNTENVENNSLTFKTKMMTPGDNFESLWKEVEQLQSKGLYESALNKVKEIHKKAMSSNNTNQVVKTTIYEIKYNQYMKEDDYVLAIDNLNSLVTKAKTPMKEVLHSLTAQVYWGYYENNRWKFNNRTNTVNFEQKDIRTWSLEKIVEHVNEHYERSLDNQWSTKLLDIKNFEEILNESKNTNGLRPTLFDFLAHRALDYYKNTEPDITKPAYAFKLDAPTVFLPAKEFINTVANSKDTSSLKLKAYNLFQNLTSFHLKTTNNINALVDLEIERLSFARSHSTILNKDSLYFNALNTLANTYKKYDCYAEINYYRAIYHVERSSKYDPYLLDENDETNNKTYKWDIKAALNLCLEAMAKYPNSYGAKLCESYKISLQSKSLSISFEDVLIPNESSKGLLTLKNLNTSYLKVIKLDYDSYSKKEFKRNEDEVDYLNKQKVVKQWEVNIEDDGDLRNHIAEIELPNLSVGYYVVLASNNIQFKYDSNTVHFSFVWSSNISYLSRRNDKNSYEFSVLNRKTGEPIPNVNAKVFYEKYNYKTRKYDTRLIGNYKTNNNGEFELPGTKQYRSVYVDFSKGDDRLNLRNSYYQSRNYNNKEKPYQFGYVFIDRGIYRPGQTVYFKGILIEKYKNESKVLANKSVEVSFYDANYQLVKTKKLTTNEYGTVSGEFISPENGMNGSMRIEMKSKNSSIATKYFRVEEYKRPKFEVSFNPIKGSFKLGQNVKVQGEAKAYAGNMIDGAKVKYRVTRSASFPWWCWYYYRYSPNSSEMEITSGETITDENGNFDVVFKAIPDESVNRRYSPTYNYHVTADVVDINGETRSSSQYVYVGYKALNVSVAIASEIDIQDKNKFLISTNNLNGQKVAAEGTILVKKLIQEEKIIRSRKFENPTHFVLTKEEHDKKFPFDLYKDENDESKWERKLISTHTFKTTDDEKEKVYLTLKKLTSLSPGKYEIEILSKDEFGVDVKEIQSFVVFDSKSKKIPLNTFSWFKPLKTSCEVGETASFLIGSSAKKTKIKYEVEHKGIIVKSQWIVLNNEQKKIEIPVEEKHRGNFSVHISTVKENRVYTNDVVIYVPFTNKVLGMTFETFRDKLLPGQKEKWKINIKGPKGEKVAAEMLATMYDASLDAFSSNYFSMNIYNSYYSNRYWSYSAGFGTVYDRSVSNNWNTDYIYVEGKQYYSLNQFGLYLGGSYYGGYRSLNAVSYSMDMDDNYAEGDMTEEEAEMSAEPMRKSESKAKPRKKNAANNLGYLDNTNGGGKKDKENQQGIKGGEGQSNGKDLTQVKARTNFNETAFFFPQLKTNSNGDINIEFEVPESLTRWKFMSMSHTKDLKVGYLNEEIVTQKDLMVVPNVPRFLREGDRITISSKISNISEKALTGEAQLFLYDAFTMKPIDGELANNKAKLPFETKAKQSTSVSWDISIPFGVQSVTYKIVAASGNFTDGEQNALPVLTNRMLVTEPMPLPIRKKGVKVFKFDKLLASSNSGSLKHHKLTLEYTSNPAWYVVQAMPYMMEYPYECSEQTFTRFYANSLATHIMNSSPKVKQIVEAWKDLSPEEFLSNLEKNQELKAVMLEETPWVMDAKSESARKQRIAQLFDLNKMTKELNRALKKLKKNQVSNGGWPWFKGGRESRYITQHIVTGLGHLDHLGVKNVRKDSKTWNMTKAAIRYLDMRIVEDYEYIKEHFEDWKTTQHLNNIHIQYMYSRSFFKDVKMSANTQEAFDYFFKQSQTYWLQFNNYAQGMIALANHRNPVPKTGIHVEQLIIASLKEKAIKHEELGMYWKGMMDGGYYWYQAPIETQALMIEAFNEIGTNKDDVEDLKAWLLKQKQTTDWKTTKATAEACYALLLQGTDLLANDDLVDVKVGKYYIDYSAKPSTNKYAKQVKADPGTGYFKTAWEGDEVTADMGQIMVTKKENGVAWGAVYWQYFEDLDKITPHKTPLIIKKKLFKQKNTDKGPVLDPISENNVLQVGDKVMVRIEIRVDRNMEYVHMKDMRASGFEPINVLSRYKWQDGLGYYESTKDASTNFFFDYLPRGTYVFEYPLRVANKGDFSNGITTIQCMYAPEFASHSEGIRVKVK